jgi:hypothetical protein
MDKKGPGSLRDLGSFEGLHPPFIDLTLMSRRGAVHCLHTYRWPRLETGPRHQQNCADCHKENARLVRSEPQESHAAPWRLQSVSNRPRGIRAAKRSPPNSSACHVQDSAENEQRAKPIGGAIRSRHLRAFGLCFSAFVCTQRRNCIEQL